MIDNFIGVFDNALSKEHCEELIKVYEDSVELNYTISRKDMGKDCLLYTSDAADE